METAIILKFPRGRIPPKSADAVIMQDDRTGATVSDKSVEPASRPSVVVNFHRSPATVSLAAFSAVIPDDAAINRAVPDNESRPGVSVSDALVDGFMRGKVAVLDKQELRRTETSRSYP
jgi:hypothetical protein